MGDYFKPWRRKFGVVTLVMACVFAAGWVRSRQKFDFINLVCGGSCYRFASRFELISLIKDTNAGTSGWASGDFASVDWLDGDGRFKLWSNFDVEWQRDIGEIVIGAGTRKQASAGGIVSCSFPYSYVVVPLTLLSAWLLLRKSQT